MKYLSTLLRKVMANNNLAAAEDVQSIKLPMMKKNNKN